MCIDDEKETLRESSNMKYEAYVDLLRSMAKNYSTNVASFLTIVSK